MATRTSQPAKSKPLGGGMTKTPSKKSPYTGTVGKKPVTGGKSGGRKGSGKI
jgi:hypothetical protein